jgi:malate dehydrogenase (oxaloacetate-decarboxylating)
VTDSLFVAAADALAELVAPAEVERGGLFPPIADLRRVTAAVAAAVVRQARDEGIGRPIADADIPGEVASAMWEPVYPELIPV